MSSKRKPEDPQMVPQNSKRLKQSSKSPFSKSTSHVKRSESQRFKSPKSKSTAIKAYFSQPPKEVDSIETFCCYCQIPFNILPIYQSIDTHIDVCVENDFKDLPPCPDGLTCQSNNKPHYSKFNHSELARFRSSKTTDKRVNISNNSQLIDDFQDNPNTPQSTHVQEGPDQVLARVDPELDILPTDIPSTKGGIQRRSSNWSDLSEIFATAPSTNNILLDPSDNPQNRTNNQPKDKTISKGGDKSRSPVRNFEIDFDRDKAKGCGTVPEKVPEEAGLQTGPCDAENDQDISRIPAETASFGDLHQTLGSSMSCGSDPMHVRATESSSGNLHIEVKLKAKVELDKLYMTIPKQDQNNQQVIDVLGRFRGQATISSFFKAPGSGNKPTAPVQPVLTGAAKKQPSMQGKFPSSSNNQGGRRYGSWDRSEVKTCPFYKKIPNTGFVVDAFNYGYVDGITKYFLSHFHYDHYRGLSKNWTGFPIFCSPITARLLQLKLRVDEKWIRVLEMGRKYIIDNVIEIRLLDANHCPGSVMFLFTFLTTGKAILHCGDFRASPKMEEYPEFWNCKLDKVYLDTTYCQPEYDFPNQSDVITQTIEIVKKHLLLHPKTLICVGAYTIGKERIFLALAEELDLKVFAATEKTRILKTLKDSVVEKRLTSVAPSARIHVVEMGKVRNPKHMKEYLAGFSNALYDKVLSIVPTGWTHQKGSSAGIENLKITSCGKDFFKCEVPYSEHSSFSELKRFVKFLQLDSADKIVPTVNNGNPDYRNAMKSLFREWVEESKK